MTTKPTPNVLPPHWTTLPEHAQITYCGWPDWDGCYTLNYKGTPDDLVAAGAATLAMVARGCKGKRRRTESGSEYLRIGPDSRGKIKIIYRYLPCHLAEGVLPGVPRTWRSVILPALVLSDHQREEFARED